MILINNVLNLLKINIIKYQYLLITSWILILLYLGIDPVIDKHIPYNLSNSYIGYHFGFIKRGLIPAILDFIHCDYHKKILKAITQTGCFSIIAVITYQLKNRLHNFDNFMAYLLIILSPLFVKNYFYDMGRSDILFFIPLLLCAFARYTTASIVVIIYPIMLLINEAISMLFLPALFYIYATRFSLNQFTKKILCLSFSMFLITSLCVLKYGNPDIDSDTLMNYLLAQKDVTTTENIPFYYYSFLDHLKFALSLEGILRLLEKTPIFIILYILHSPILKAISHTLYVTDKHKYTLLFLISGLLPLSLIAIDRIRFLCDIFGILIICAMAVDKKIFMGTLIENLNKHSMLVRMILLLSIVAIPYAGVVFIEFRLPIFTLNIL
jgi:hypothetical protein